MDLDVLEGCAQHTPEVLIVFVEPELRTDILCKEGGAYSTSSDSLPNLKSVLARSSITLTAPYVTVTSSHAHQLLDNALAHVAENIKQGSITVARDGDSTLFTVLRQLTGVQTVSLESLTEYLKEHKEIFTNEVADLIVVTFESPRKFSEHDVIIGQVSALISKETSGNYVGVYTGNAPIPSKFQWRFPISEEEAQTLPSFSMYTLVGNETNNNITNTTKINYFPGPILEAFMVVIPLITMLFVGLCGLFNLQVPEKYESPKAQQKLI